AFGNSAQNTFGREKGHEDAIQKRLRHTWPRIFDLNQKLPLAFGGLQAHVTALFDGFKSVLHEIHENFEQSAVNAVDRKRKRFDLEVDLFEFGARREQAPDFFEETVRLEYLAPFLARLRQP